MELTPGTRLGAYEIVSPIGAGGMGEVFKARDTRLDRTVAIKVMPKYIAARADLRARFEREARTVSNLNHPSICVLFDIGKQDGTDFMVLEFLEGETLAARISKGPLPLDQALKYATQIADALDRAHRSGVSHRDVKPANVMITRDGCKILDFGLAKSAPKAVGPDDPTLTAALTSEGTIMGTPQYMAPEQYEGKEADARSDIFAFGCVLYEMVTGKRIFDGKTRASLIASVLGADPAPMSALIPVTPPALERLVTRCLAKDPEDRWQSMRDVVLELRSIAEGGTEVKETRLSPRVRFVPWIAAGVLAAIAAGFAVHDWRRGSQTVSGTPVRFSMEIAPAEELGNLEFATYHPSRTAVAISPDGGTVVFSATRGKVVQLYKRAMDRPEAAAIPGTEGAIVPFFSPDGQWVGFYADAKLKKVPVNGGPAASICSLPQDPFGISGASWGSKDDIVFAQSGSGLMTVPAAGGTPRTLLKPDSAKNETFWAPHWLPDGKSLLFTVRTSDSWEEAQIVVRRLDTGVQHVLVKGGADARYAASGHLVYIQNAVLMAVPFDDGRLELTGSPAAIQDGVMQAVSEPNARTETGMGQFAVSTSGTLIYASGGLFPARMETLMSVDRRGTQTELNLPKGDYVGLRISPNGQKLAFAKQSGTSREADVWVLDMTRGTSVRLTQSGTNGWPLWSPDGKRILFNGGWWNGRQILSTADDGSGAVEPDVTGKAEGFLLASRSADGKRLAYLKGRDGRYGVWISPASGEGEPKLFLSSPKFSYADAAFSPDGNWIAYVSNESGRNEVYVQAFPGPGDKHLISNGGGTNPMWAPNGRELFFTGTGSAGEGKHRMMVVDITPGASFQVGAPRVLFEGSWEGSTPLRSYDITPDGQHFIMRRQEELPDQRVTKLNVVLNWFDELGKRASRTAQ